MTVLSSLIIYAILSAVLAMLEWIPTKKAVAHDAKPLTKKESIATYLAQVLLSFAILFYYGISVQAVLLWMLFFVLFCIAVIDAKTQEIPPYWNIAILVLGIIAIFVFPQVSIVSRLIGMLLISVPLFMIIQVIRYGFGGGDIKMMFAAGFFLGAKAIVIAFFIGIVSGAVYAVFLLLTKRRKKTEHFALGPFLSVGVAVSVYADIGIQLVDSYLYYILHSMQM